MSVDDLERKRLNDQAKNYRIRAKNAEATLSVANREVLRWIALYDGRLIDLMTSMIPTGLEPIDAALGDGGVVELGKALDYIDGIIREHPGWLDVLWSPPGKWTGIGIHQTPDGEHTFIGDWDTWSHPALRRLRP